MIEDAATNESLMGLNVLKLSRCMLLTVGNMLVVRNIHSLRWPNVPVQQGAECPARRGEFGSGVSCWLIEFASQVPQSSFACVTESICTTRRDTWVLSPFRPSFRLVKEL